MIMTKNIYKIGKKLFITSDEVIKEKDYFYQGFDCCIHKCYKLTDNYIIAVKPSDYPKNICKKIILTTDQDLIADGVQAIDNEFLEWFAKNLSCEVVEVNWVKTPDGIFYHQENVPYGCYKIIIPKKELTKDEIDKFFVDMVCNPKEPKQETLEEAAEKFRSNNPGTMQGGNNTKILNAFKNGAKWQQEQDSNWFNEYQEVENYIINKIGDKFLKSTPEKYKTASQATIALLKDNWQQERSYSEEDMLNASKYGYNFHKTTLFPNQKFEDSCINNTKQWLTLFKKK